VPRGGTTHGCSAASELLGGISGNQFFAYTTFSRPHRYTTAPTDHHGAPSAAACAAVDPAEASRTLTPAMTSLCPRRRKALLRKADLFDTHSTAEAHLRRAPR